MEAIFQQLEMHMIFICPECGETFELQQQWRQHLNFYHDYLCKTPEDFGFAEINDRYHECLECNQLVADGKRAIALLQYHRFVHLPYKCTYKCRHCHSTFMRKRVCFNHLCRVHEGIVGKKLAAAAMQTPMLANRKESITKLPASNSSSCIARHNPEFYLRCICPQCGYELNRCDDWLKHIETAHRQSVRQDNALQQIAGTEDYLCTICNKMICTTDKEKHQRHYFCHLPHKLNFRCAYCKIRRPFKTEILYHFMTTHLLVFQRQRIYMRKPKEFGHDVNRKLDKELDLLLKNGNSVSSRKQSTAATATSQRQRSLTPISRNKLNAQSEKSVLDSNAGVDMEAKQTRENGGKASNIKKELDALCAEIFKDIENDEMIPTNIIETTNANVLTCVSENFMPDNMEQLASGSRGGGETNFNSQSNGNNKNTASEEVVSIEIDALDEHELSQFDENDESSQFSLNDAVMSETAAVGVIDLYDNIKALYNAKVLHLCPQCGIPFAEQSIWRDHVLKTHEKLCKSVEQNYRELENQTFLCLTCNNTLETTSRTELQRHRFTHMPYSAYLMCSLCGKCELSKPQMLEHLDKQHFDLLKSGNELQYQPVLQQKTQPEQQQQQSRETRQVEKFVENAPQIEKTLSTSSENSDYFSLLTHLKQARERLNRMAAEYGIQST